MKFLAIILSIIVVTLAVAPCCTDDNCEDEYCQTEQAHNKGSDKPESPCSPFVSCTCCPGVCIAPSIGCVVAPITVVEKTITLYKQSIVSFYCANIWQPPKIAC
jgi:hypothetical protein